MLLRTILPLYSRSPLFSSSLIASKFSTYFEEKDKLELQNLKPKPVFYKPYKMMVDLWKKPLQKKRLRKARISEIKITKQIPQPQEEKFIIHNPIKGIESPYQIFCILDIDGSQIKIQQGCKVVLDKRSDLKVGDQVTYNKIMLIGARDFTVLGRPYLTDVTVKAVVQQKPSSRKTIVLKKKRRKQYRRNIGYSTQMTVLRITKINFELSQNLLNKAVALE